MSIDTQNNFTPEEEQFMDKLTQTLRGRREHELIRNVVKNKIASTDFRFGSRPSIPKWKTAVYAGGALLLTTFIVFFIINNNSKVSQTNQNIDQATVDTQQEKTVSYPKKDSFYLGVKVVDPIADHPSKIDEKLSKQKGDAVTGLGSGNSKNADLKGETLSFFEEFKFSPKADFKKFKSDLKIVLDRTDLNFREKTGKDEMLNFETQNLKGITDQKVPVDYFIRVKVDKRFPGSLKLSLRYVYEKDRTSYLSGDSIEKIFYDRVKSRITGLISWKYKPE